MMMHSPQVVRRWLHDLEPMLPRSLTDEADVAVRADAIEAAGYPALADIARSLVLEGPLDMSSLRRALWNDPAASEHDELEMDALEGPLQRRAHPRERSRP